MNAGPRNGALRLGIDCRRLRFDGVGRFTELIVTALLRRLPHIDVVAFGDPDEIAFFGPRISVVPYREKLLSPRAYAEFPGVVRSHGIDVFLAPQYYTSPLLECPQVRVLHDAFPLRDDFFPPSSAAFEGRFGADGLRRLAHMIGLDDADRSDGTGLTTGIIGRLYRMSVARAAAVVTVSEYSREDLARFLPRYADKFFVVPLYAGEGVAGGAEGRRGRNGGKGVLHVSKWEPRKRQIELVDVLERVRDRRRLDARLLLVGKPAPSFPEYCERLRDRLVKADAWTSVEAEIPDEVLRERYRGAGVFCTFSEQEGFGLPVLEAMSHGLPCLVPRAGALPEVCGDAVAYLPFRREGLEEAVGEFLTDADLLDHLGEAAFRRAAEFGSVRTAESIGRVLERVTR
ncbi:glycosyltransferase [Actinomadura kijaniata]|uniref:glycosyltransferase n=1 Tax=Actinomadura kijaniata TaxID=46161 RepID=UPI003F1BB8C1